MIHNWFIIVFGCLIALVTTTPVALAGTDHNHSCFRPYEPNIAEYSESEIDRLKKDYSFYLKDVEDFINCQNAEISKVRSEATKAIKNYDRLITNNPAQYKKSDFPTQKITDEDLPELGTTFN